jgi:glycerol uptake facilitator-like aquaporin
MIYRFTPQIFRKVGSCHFNPAFSLCSLFHGNVTVPYCLVSCVVQIVAVGTATFLLSVVLNKDYEVRYATVLKPEGW